ncbi:hypothetical protein K474DRAFT_1661305 [Panus rudis PR-1116 ss-1]|nr:hypothetical protein K474DRAFT_1661305 [Panus rudis PR-1116 ss-1]
MSEVDAAFTLLPASTRARIDRAFDSVLAESDPSHRPRKKPKVAHESSSFGGGGFLRDDDEDQAPGGFIPSGGGFIVDDPTPAAGGFVVDEPSSSSAGGFLHVDDKAEEDGEDDDTTEPNDNDKIALSDIPTALQLLDLQPDDEDVLAVFRNAASGWNERTSRAAGRSAPNETEQEQYVSRRDWRAVCAALLDTGDRQETSEDDKGSQDNDVEMRDEEEDEVPSGEEFNPSEAESSLSELEDDDEYVQGGFTPSKSKGKAKEKEPKKHRRSRRKASLSESEEEASTPKRITPRQKAECRRTFALFFPDVDDKDLDNKKIMIKDITRVAALLKEKITAEETVEMLEAFSTSADKSMSLADFERMMIATKMA